MVAVADSKESQGVEGYECVDLTRWQNEAKAREAKRQESRVTLEELLAAQDLPVRRPRV